jgi:hypothetical protein
MSIFDDLAKEVVFGLEGRNDGIPMGFNRLNRYVGIRKSIYFLVGGLTGSGKTSFIDDAFVLNPYDWFVSPENKTKIKLRIIYRSMERNRTYKLAKWVGRKIFIDQAIIIPVSKLLGWGDRMSKDEHDLFLMYKDYINNMSEIITIIDGPENPIGIAKQLREHALSRGRIEEIDQYNKVYIPNDENEITIVVEDTLNLLKLTKEFNSKKAAIDKMSDENRYARDFFGYTIVAVSQFNRMISNIQRLKNGDVEPQLEDFKETGQSQDDADVVMTLFDPLRYKVADSSGYNLDRLVNDEGSKFFRSLKIIKNSYGSDDVRIGLAFNGALGQFKELPKRSIITEDDYDSVLNKSFFLQNK